MSAAATATLRAGNLVIDNDYRHPVVLGAGDRFRA